MNELVKACKALRAELSIEGLFGDPPLGDRVKKRVWEKFNATLDGAIVAEIEAEASRKELSKKLRKISREVSTIKKMMGNNERYTLRKSGDEY